MTVSLTLFRWVALYSSISCPLKGPISERAHIVIVVPSSRADLSMDAGLLFAVWQPASSAAAHTAAAPAEPRMRPTNSPSVSAAETYEPTSKYFGIELLTFTLAITGVNIRTGGGGSCDRRDDQG